MEIKKLGRFEIVEEIGSGGMGIVYKGRDPKINRLVALKVIRPQAGTKQTKEQKQAAQRFYVEAQAAGQLSHPNIVTIYDVGEESANGGDLVYIAMEFLDGHGLDYHISANTFSTIKQKINIIRQIAEGLHYAHRRGVIHRDVKPANIIVTESNIPKLTDFGLARLSDSSLTLAGTILGTPNYMAPEQVQGKKVDARSDFFALTVILYEMLTSQKPFAADTITSVIYRVVNDDPIPPREIKASLPPFADEMIRRGLAKKPEERFQNGEEFMAALRKLQQDAEMAYAATGETTMELRRVPPEEDSGTVLVGEKAPPRREYMIAAAAAALIVIAGSVYFMIGGGEKPAPVEVAKIEAPAAPPAEARKVQEQKPPVEPAAPRKEAKKEEPKKPAEPEKAPKTAAAPKPSPAKPAAKPAPAAQPEQEPAAPVAAAVEPAPVIHRPARAEQAPEYGYMDISSEPEGADVFINEKYIGATPINNIRLVQGDIRLVVKKDGFLPSEKTVELGEEKRAVKISLLKGGPKAEDAAAIPISGDFGALELFVPADSVIFVDGKEYREEHLTLRELSAGSHILHVQMKGRAPHSERIVLEAGKKKRIDLR